MGRVHLPSSSTQRYQRIIQSLEQFVATSGGRHAPVPLVGQPVTVRNPNAGLPGEPPTITYRNRAVYLLAQGIPGLGAETIGPLGPANIAGGVGERVFGQATGEVARRVGVRAAPIVARLRRRPSPSAPVTPTPPLRTTEPIPQVTQTQGETATQRLLTALRAAQPVRAEQEALYTAERGRRLGKALAIGQHVSGQAGFRQQLGALKGELPKPEFAPLKIGQSDLDELYQQIELSPLVAGFQKIRAKGALSKLFGAYGGQVPQEGELALLSRVFGDDVVRELAAKRGTMPAILSEIASIPRALAATLDLSAPFRQGLVAGVRYPRQFVRAFGDMFRAAFREESYQALKRQIVERPTYQLMDEAGLALTGLDEGVLLGREEQFLSRLPERIPIFGRIIRGSNRAYTGFLMKLRADVFDELLKRAQAAGVPQTDALTNGIARFVNTATGRGDLGQFEVAGNALSTVLFSPRLLAARLNMLNPLYYRSLPPMIRKEALRAVLNLAATGTAILGLAKLAGTQVGSDPRSADFGKMRIRNTRIDVWGGFQQYPRIAAQMVTGKLISSTTGREYRFGEGYRPLTRKQIAERFFEAKANPLIGTILEIMEGRTFEGQPVRLPYVAKRLLTPIITQDLYDLARDDPALLPAMIPAVFGLDVQTYGPRRPTGAVPGIDARLLQVVPR